MRWEEADGCFLLKVCFTQRSWGEKPRGILAAEAVAPQQSLQQWGVSTENGWLMTLLLPLDRDFKKKKSLCSAQSLSLWENQSGVLQVI